MWRWISDQSGHFTSFTIRQRPRHRNKKAWILSFYSESASAPVIVYLNNNFSIMARFDGDFQEEKKSVF